MVLSDNCTQPRNPTLSTDIHYTRLLQAITHDFRTISILVVGDLMLDRYLWGEVSRISPEAPVPVVRLNRVSENPGAAANVAMNLVRLGVQCRLAGFVGQDTDGAKLKEIVTAAGIDATAIWPLSDHPTITKTRIIGGHQQMLRLDLEDTRPPGEADRSQFVERLLRMLDTPPIPGAVILSDYGKGALGNATCQAIIQAARARNLPVVVDPKGVDYSRYHGATTLTPNRRELAEAVPWPYADLAGLLGQGERMIQSLGLDFLTVTLSELGIALLEPDTAPRRIPAMAKEVYDVSGAGDTVVATLTVGLAAGLSRMEALHLANLAAGVVVGKVGTTPITYPEILAALSTDAAMGESDKICDRNRALTRVTAWREMGNKIVFTNGCFDLLHAGHVTYLEKARRLGQRLIIGLNTDASVRRLKGDSRPVINENDRARVLAAMASIDMVVLFDDDTPLHLIKTLRPHVLAKGADYTLEQVVGYREVLEWGGECVLIPLVEGKSSSRIVEHIKHP
ncbi:MAG: bifunctional D-glycero-beta-D-manno-heptose-7-phosphate kinase/D-glycero-beta-D-manno-heptose 1-phosphate adenylyltransferase HldE [Magnetococcales bacterium]|nr:bifunctional D-glycero-beta-D-manno-heptose-7-phosphate kinase/D-glycero-beta-D-manno-heptose 1-phosphate adenylyltransferase HldE [Magnetococcales bacterium]